MSKKDKIILILLGIVCYFIFNSSANAEIINGQAHLQFDRIENPFGLTASTPYTFTEEELSKNYQHISIANNQLYVFFYDEPFTYDSETNTYSSVRQSLKVNKYDYTDGNFAYANSVTWSGSNFSETNVIWSSYSLNDVAEDTFPNVSKNYNDLLQKINNSPQSLENLQFLINTFLKEIYDVPFAIFYHSGFGIKILYTPDGLGIVGNGNGLSGGGFNYSADSGSENLYSFDLPYKDFESIDQNELLSLIVQLDEDINTDNISTNNSFGGFSPENDFVLVWYMASDYIFIENNQWGDLIWDDQKYLDSIPCLSYKLDLNINIDPSPSPTPSVDDTLKDDNVDGSVGQAGSFFEDFKTDTFGLTSIITSPLKLIESITSKTCKPLVLQTPFVNKNIELPCLTPIYKKYFGSFLTIYQSVTFGLISYWIIVRIFNLVKDFKNPDHDEIEVFDL